MGKMSRTKGHGFERLVAQAFRVIFPKAMRQLEYQAGLGVDLANTGNLRVQCKRGRQYAPFSKLEEAKGGPGFPGIPLLVTQADRKEALVALRLVDFLRILDNPLYAKGVDYGAPHNPKAKDDCGKDGGCRDEGGDLKADAPTPAA